MLTTTTDSRRDTDTGTGAMVPDGEFVRPIRVAHIHSSLGLYGSDRWTLTLVRHHDRRAVQPLVVTLGNKPGGDQLAKFSAVAGVRAQHISGRAKLDLGMIRHLRQLILAEQIDIVHTHGFKSDIVAYLATIGLPVRLVATVHGWCAGQGPRISFYEALGRQFLKRFARVYPVSPAQREELIGRYRFHPAQVHLMLNAVDTAMFDDCFARRRARRPESPLRILFAGRLSKTKGLFDLLQAFALAELGPGTTLSIAGDGPDQQAAETMSADLGIASRTRFLGVVADVRPLFDACDVLVLPSYSEGIPRILMEASAAGVPVIATDIPGNRQLIEEGRTGLLIPVGDPPALARAFERTAAAPGDAHQQACRARSVVESRFAAARLAREFEAEYCRLLGEFAPAPDRLRQSDMRV